jgi:hypothetical protein
MCYRDRSDLQTLEKMKKFLISLLEDITMWRGYFFNDNQHCVDNYARCNIIHQQAYYARKIVEFEAAILNLRRDELCLQLRLSNCPNPRITSIYKDLIKTQADIANLQNLINQFKSFN